MAKELKSAPREVFEQLLEYMVIPTFDLVIEYGQQGIILVRRTIAPHQRQYLSTGYWIKVPADRPLTPNPAHFSELRITYALPRPMGAMYRHYLQRCQELRAG